MRMIDADAHVVESDRTWDYLDPADQKYRPIIVGPKAEGQRQFWMLQGKVVGLARSVLTAQQYAVLSERAGREMATPQEAREMENVEVRLRHMDDLGIDIQVLHPTIFIERVADTPEAEIPICRAYNRWLADIWARGNDRLRWSCVPPVLDIRAGVEEMRYSKQHGACAVFLRGIEGERLITDPYFFPIYEEAQRLDLAVVVHVANGNPEMVDMLQRYNSSGFWPFRLTTIGTFHAVVMSGLPVEFPKLRFAFVEAASGWLPYALNDLRRRLAARGQTLPDDALKEYRLYVTCQNDDDVPYVLQKAGEDNILIGTDYGHNDQSTEIEALRTLGDSGGITPAQYQKIVYDNPKRLYAL
jgi:predicted TIM-barrel fold metal-dependent hydrolase